MKLAAIYNVWDDYELLKLSVANITLLVDGIIIVASARSNYGEISIIPPVWANSPDVYIKEPSLAHPMHAETSKRNYGLEIAKQQDYTHFVMMDADEFYDPISFLRERKRMESNPNLLGLVCDSRVYFARPELTIGMDTTRVPFIHKITSGLRHEFNRQYPFAWEGRDIRIDPTRSFNINSGVEMSPIIMEHFSWVRNDMNAYKRKIRNSTARHNLERSNILQDLVNAKEGYFCQFYQKYLVRVPNRFNIPYGELSNKDLQPLASTNPQA